MFQITSGFTQTCGGLSRRQILQAGGAGLCGLSLAKLFAAEEASESIAPRAKSVIFLFLFGGPSQLETFDMKPDAPDTIRGPFKPIASRTPELRISEHLPRMAAISDRFSVIRTMSHNYNDHSGGGHYIQTGHRWQVPVGGGFNVTPQDWPSIGSVVDYVAAQQPGTSKALPTYMVLPNSLGRLQEYSVQLRRPGETAGWLGHAHAPVNTRIDKRDAKDNPYWRDCTDDELTFQIDGMAQHASLSIERMRQRNSLLAEFDKRRRALESGAIESYGKMHRRALDLVTSSQAREALDITREPASLRDRYGRHLFGQSTLMARRLIEAGTRFVTVHYDCIDGY
ncbi:DUF1501 domain-containing protein, partial [Durusdinium trenchii]